MTDIRYSALKAVMGSRRDAWLAGYTPAITPTPAPIPTPRNTLHSSTAAGSGLTIAMNLAKPKPVRTPRAAPTVLSVALSTRNWLMMSRRRAPSDLRMPISRVRSATATSMMFMMTMAPTTSPMAGSATPAIGLVVGAIVIMNIMLVAVAERTREISIRKSLGARRRDIMSQFLVESATLSTVVAALGVATGFAFAKLISMATPLPAAVEMWSVLLGISIGAGVGIIAGVYPASRASRLDPITALRAE